MPEGFEHIERFRSTSSALEGDGKPPEPTLEELDQHIVSPGEEALLPLGLVYQAPWEPFGDGMARHARAQARALSHAGIPVSLRSLPVKRMMLDDEIDPGVLAEVGYLRRTSIGRAPIAIRQAVIPSYTFLESLIAPAGARLSGFEAERDVYASTIIYTSWERDTVHPDIVEVLNRCAAVWVPCSANAEAFRKAGVHKIYVIPCPYDPNTSAASQIPEPRGSATVPHGKRFYAIGKWEPRKNYHALLGAFLTGFAPKGYASLFIKTTEWGNWDNYPNVQESLAYWLAADKVKANGWTAENLQSRVRVVTKKLPEEKITKLHKDNNIYVSCSHGEAWDMPAFDAACAGNRLVYTGYGGAEDYQGMHDIQILSTPETAEDFEPVHPGYGWETNARWASVSMEAIRAALVAAELPRTRVHPPALYSLFGYQRVGQQMLTSICEVNPKAYDVLIHAGGFG